MNKYKMEQCHISLQRAIHVVMRTSGETFQQDVLQNKMHNGTF